MVAAKEKPQGHQNQVSSCWDRECAEDFVHLKLGDQGGIRVNKV